MKTNYNDFRVLLVDNASQDGSSEFVREAYPSVRIIRHPVNLGFAGGNNAAMQVALDDGADYVLLLNDDTMILDPDWLTKAVDVAESDHAVGMVGFDLSNDATRPVPPTRSVRDVRRVSGCALLIKAEVLRGVGLLDEVYFAYAEESDLEARALRAGYLIKEVNSPVYHVGSGTFKKFRFKLAYLFLRNLMRFSIKNEPIWKSLLRPLVILYSVCSPARILHSPRDRQLRARVDTGSFAGNAGAFVAALAWNVAFLPKTLLIRMQDERRIRAVRASRPRLSD